MTWHGAEGLRPLLRPVETLREDPRNVRRHGERSVAALARSLERFGQQKPVVIAAGVVRAGSGTLAAARSLGWAHLAVVETELGGDELTAYALADNRTAELSEWDDAGLAAVLRDLRAEEVDLAGLGFDAAELARLMAVADGPSPSGPEGEDEEEEELDEDQVSGLPPVPEDAAKAPFPWFGGKRRVAGAVWAALGDVALYVEPFAGSLACLLARPLDHVHDLATVNDLDAYVCNFFRALKADPDAVAEAADGPVNEVDLLARHRWLVSTGRERLAALEADPEHYDARVAGWWCWGLAAWIGSGWCAPEARWDPAVMIASGKGIANSMRPHMSRKGQGVHRQLPFVGHAGRGVHRQRPHVGDTGRGVCAEHRAAVGAWFQDLADRLRNTRVCGGDWARVVTLGATSEFRSVGVLLDPPYGGEDVDRVRCYGVDDHGDLSARVRARALELAADPRYRIVLCGYEVEHGPHMPATWRKIAWKTKGAMQRRATAGTTRTSANRHCERLWLSPSCLPVTLPDGRVV